jgi:hypothetical protein
MRPRIRSGRCWVPPEWRGPLDLRMLQHSALVAVAGVRGRDDASQLLAAHLPLLAPGEDADGDPEPAPDTDGARRMARRLSRIFPAAGLRELATAGYLPHHIPAVYAWRAARHGEYVFRISPDGTFAPVAVFRVTRVQGPAGQWDSQLVASRPW